MNPLNDGQGDTGQATGQPQAAPEPKFTQADLDRIAAKVRSEVRNQFADYDTIKSELEQRKASELTEAERLQRDLDAARKVAEEARQQAQAETLKTLRFQVAFEKGLSAKMAARLTGATYEELMADADSLLEDAKQLSVPQPSTRPTPPQLDGGAGLGQRGQGLGLTSEEITLAGRMNMTPEQYAAAKKKMSGR